MYVIILVNSIEDYKNKDIVLSDIDCNNNPLNVVPKYCSSTISVKNNIDIDERISEYNKRNPIINGIRHDIPTWCNIYNIKQAIYLSLKGLKENGKLLSSIVWR